MRFILRVTLAASLLFSAPLSFAATRYVTDELRISLRTGQGNEYRIIEVITSGTRVETRQIEGEWAEIRTPQGNTGWVRSQYLDEQPVAEERLRNTRAELESARQHIRSLEDELTDARTAADESAKQVAQLEARIKTLQSRVENAREGLDLYAENQLLSERVDALVERVADLQAHRENLEDRNRKEWFLIGAGVLFGGMIAGIILTRIPWRRRRDRMF